MKLNISIDKLKEPINIFDINVPDQLRKRVKSGVTYIDDALGGKGFTPSCVTLFTGTPGAGKTTMMLELANSLTGNGCNVLFNTAEESLYQLKLTVERLKLRHGFMAGQERHVPDLLESCSKIMKKDKKPFFHNF